MLKMEYSEDKSIRDRIVQLLITRKYNKQGVTLPDKFWNLPKYKEEYARQTISVAKFIRAYGPETVLNVINREGWCWSLGPKKMPDLMALEVAKLKRDSEKIKNNIKTEESPTLPTSATLFRKKKEDDG